MKSDLKDGVSEGTKLIKDKRINKKQIIKKLKKIKKRFDLKELKLITDKIEGAKETVHVYGKVNPSLNGESSIINDEISSPFKLKEKEIIFRIPRKELVPMKNYREPKKTDVFEAFKIEYKRQLSLQKKGINEMKAIDWLKNHQAFIEKREDEKRSGLKNPSGRDPKGDSDLKIVEELLYKDLRRIYITKTKTDSEIIEKYKGLKRGEQINQIQIDAKAYAEEYLSGKSILHNPDQVAGRDSIVSERYHKWVELKGKVNSEKDIDELGVIGYTDVNRWIGTMWRTRAKKLNIDTKSQIEKISKENEIGKLVQGAIMNVKIILKDGEVIQ